MSKKNLFTFFPTTALDIKDLHLQLVHNRQTYAIMSGRALNPNGNFYVAIRYSGLRNSGAANRFGLVFNVTQRITMILYGSQANGFGLLLHIRKC